MRSKTCPSSVQRGTSKGCRDRAQQWKGSRLKPRLLPCSVMWLASTPEIHLLTLTNFLPSIKLSPLWACQIPTNVLFIILFNSATTHTSYHSHQLATGCAGRLHRKNNAKRPLNRATNMHAHAHVWVSYVRFVIFVCLLCNLTVD